MAEEVEWAALLQDLEENASVLVVGTGPLIHGLFHAINKSAPSAELL